MLIAIADALGLGSSELMESAEVRRDRNRMEASEEYPGWLTGRRQGAPQSMAGTAPLASGTSPAADFRIEMERLSTRLSDSDREVLLAMARKLAGA